jgi:hypothetical protein
MLRRPFSNVNRCKVAKKIVRLTLSEYLQADMTVTGCMFVAPDAPLIINLSDATSTVVQPDFFAAHVVALAG